MGTLDNSAHVSWLGTDRKRLANLAVAIQQVTSLSSLPSSSAGGHCSSPLTTCPLTHLQLLGALAHGSARTATLLWGSSNELSCRFLYVAVTQR